MVEITLAILTLNEEAYIDQCLKYHKSFFGKIIILDGNSTDKTTEITKRYSAKVYFESDEGTFDSFATRRNFLADHCKTEWIFQIDTDELVDYNFLKNIEKYVEPKSELRNEETVAFSLPRINLDNGHPIDYHVRLYKKDMCEWQGKVHEILVLKEVKKPVDQIKINDREICQILDGHYIIHLHRPEEERIRQRARWEKRIMEET